MCMKRINQRSSGETNGDDMYFLKKLLPVTVRLELKFLWCVPKEFCVHISFFIFKQTLFVHIRYKKPT